MIAASPILTAVPASGRPTRLSWLTAAIVPAGGAVGLLLITRWGIGTSVDSVAYIRAARVLADGGGGTVLVQHAPLYSLVLAVGGTLGVDPIAGARWLNALTFAANIYLVGLLIRHSVTHLRWLWIVGSILILALPPMLEVHVTALSEPIFLTCTLSGFWLLAGHLEMPARSRLAGAALLIGLAMLARYAGAACVLTGVLALLAFAPGPRGRRLLDAALFAAVASAPMAAWVVRNLFVASTATGREISFHPVGMAHAWQALYTMSAWLLIPPSAPNAARFAVWLALGVLAVMVAVRRRGPVPSAVRVLSLFVATYGAFLVVSISLVDANTPLDNRILLPVLAAGVVLLAFGVDCLWPMVRGTRALAYAGVGVMALLVGGHGLQAAELAAAGYRQGWGFSSAMWRQSPTLHAVDQLDRRTTVFSNAPEIVYLRTGRQARGLPRSRFLMSQQPNAEFDRQLSDVTNEVRETCGVVAYLRNLNQKAMPSEAELERKLSLEVLVDTGDGVIWGVTACRP